MSSHDKERQPSSSKDEIKAFLQAAKTELARVQTLLTNQTAKVIGLEMALKNAIELGLDKDDMDIFRRRLADETPILQELEREKAVISSVVNNYQDKLDEINRRAPR